jgi:hypothetical protein
MRASPRSQVFLHLNTTDTYQRLPVKVIGSLQWLSAHVSYKYVLKTDDDAWICMHEVLQTLSPLPRTALYWGFINRVQRPIGNFSHKGFVHTEFIAYFKKECNPVYAFGAAYVLSADVADAISDTGALDAAEHVRIEDVLVGELISRRLGSAVRIVDAQTQRLTMGYRFRKDKGEHPTKTMVRQWCGPGRKMIVHRILPTQVRLCHQVAKGRCACVSAPGRCSGRPEPRGTAVTGKGGVRRRSRSRLR